MKKIFGILFLAFLVISCASNNINIDLSSFDRVYFAHGKSDLSAKSKKTLNSQVNALKIAENVKIVLKCYADITGNPEFNRELSHKRALSVKDYFVKKGINESNIDVEFFGSDSPIKNDKGEIVNEENRVCITTLK